MGLMKRDASSATLRTILAAMGSLSNLDVVPTADAPALTREGSDSS